MIASKVLPHRYHRLKAHLHDLVTHWQVLLMKVPQKVMCTVLQIHSILSFALIRTTLFQGKWEKIGGIDCYVGIPSGIEYPKDKVLLFLSDVFGMQLINNQVCRCIICSS